MMMMMMVKDNDEKGFLTCTQELVPYLDDEKPYHIYSAAEYEQCLYLI